MSGHSKWSQIKRQKGVADVRRGQEFTKLGNAITIAVREGGGIADPDANFRLRLIMEKARMANMPKENIQRAIDKAVGKGEGGQLAEVYYEGFGPHNIAVMVETVTDNKLRTQATVKNYMEKNGGVFGSSGSVAYLFNKSGLISVNKKDKIFDDIFLLAIDGGAEDVEESDEIVDIYTPSQDLHKIKKILESDGLDIISAELIMKPTTTVEIDDGDKAQKAINFLQGLEDLDDVQKVYSNIKI